MKQNIYTLWEMPSSRDSALIGFYYFELLCKPATLIHSNSSWESCVNKYTSSHLILLPFNSTGDFCWLLWEPMESNQYLCTGSCGNNAERQTQKAEVGRKNLKKSDIWNLGKSRWYRNNCGWEKYIKITMPLLKPPTPPLSFIWHFDHSQSWDRAFTLCTLEPEFPKHCTYSHSLKASTVLKTPVSH